MSSGCVSGIVRIVVRWLVTLGIVGLAVASGPARAAEIVVGGRSVAVIQPEGYCWLDTNGSENLMALQAAEILSRAGQELLVMFADCKELTALRAGKVYYFRRHGSITAFVDRSGKVVPASQSRSEVLEINAEALAKASGRSLDSIQRSANRILPGTITELSAPRLIHRDQNALYIAGVTKARSATGKNRTIAGVSAYTVLNGIEANVILHEETNSEPYEFSTLLVRSKSLVAELVRANP